MITTNIDRFAGRSYAEVHSSGPLTEFNGLEVGNYAHTIQAGKPFVTNLHGTLQNDSSWIFTAEDLARIKTPSFFDFFIQCLSSRTLLFIGISADDFAIAEHLRRLKSHGVRFGGHYWITHRNDRATDEFAEQYGLLRIAYSLAESGDAHREVAEFIEDIKKFIAKDEPPPIVIPETKKERNVSLPTPEELQTLPAEQIRQVLNQEAVRILKSNSPTKEDDYDKLLKKYDECVYRLWRVTAKEPNNILFGYKIISHVSKGGFGNVYEAVSPEGEKVAIKVLLENIREDRSMLESFRRGVYAMRLLEERKIDGIVCYKHSWELPACTVMDYVDGYSLEDAVDSKFIRSWATKFRIGTQLVSILQNAHSVPEHVLHRDLRPPNIMLEGFHSPDDDGDWKVVVLDFDLCWHKGATGNSVNPDSITIAYHAPEQYQQTEKSSRRSALVDSFGIGMTLFFLFSGNHPQPYSVQNNIAWLQELKWKIGKLECQAWKSLPHRLARLIFFSTMNDQQFRWDLTKIAGEMKRLSETLRATKPNDPELIAEEIAARCERLNDYVWSQEHLRAVVATVTGFDFWIWGNEGSQKIEASICWSNQGDRDFSTVKKYLLPNVDKVVSCLKNGGWSASVVSRGYDQVKIGASIELARIKTTDDITRFANSFAEGASCLKLM
ncbi:protein kinase domain-containing protein [Prosthecobacter sp.]|uniref:protein kinase domain-containing protein n=1 Tax=Prosthecobacter sp. TaxID=1965333 RepID=UPI00378494C7